MRSRTNLVRRPNAHSIKRAEMMLASVGDWVLIRKLCFVKKSFDFFGDILYIWCAEHENWISRAGLSSAVEVTKCYKVFVKLCEMIIVYCNYWRSMIIHQKWKMVQSKFRISMAFGKLKYSSQYDARNLAAFSLVKWNQNEYFSILISI